jgi:hypothetical protein
MSKCVSCGKIIFKSGREDPFLCRLCERNKGIDVEKYWFDV